MVSCADHGESFKTMEPVCNVDKKLQDIFKDC